MDTQVKSPLVERIMKRVRAFFDPTAWLLFAVSLIPLAFIDRAMLLTLVQWTAYSLTLVGAAVGLSRLLFPTLDLAAFVTEARKGSVAAGLVVRAVALTLGMLFLGRVLWAKA